MLCTICYDASEKSHYISTKCGHIFHLSCINNWYRVSHLCPLCRVFLDTSEFRSVFVESNENSLIANAADNSTTSVILPIPDETKYLRFTSNGYSISIQAVEKNGLRQMVPMGLCFGSSAIRNRLESSNPQPLAASSPFDRVNNIQSNALQRPFIQAQLTPYRPAGSSGNGSVTATNRAARNRRFRNVESVVARAWRR